MAHKVFRFSSFAFGLHLARFRRLVLGLLVASATLTGCGGGGSEAGGGTSSTTGAPMITSGNSATFVVGTAGTFAVMATGTPTPTLSEAGTLPAGVTFTDNGNGSGTLGGTPSAGNCNTYGTYRFTITAHNGMGTDDTQNFTLTLSQPTNAAGWIVATHFDSGQAASNVNVYRADVNGAPPFCTIPGGNADFVDPSTGLQLVLSGAGLPYGVNGGIHGFAEVGIIAPGGKRITLANQTSHAYRFAPGFQSNGRLIVQDATAAGAPYSVISFALDGSGVTTLKAGCATQPLLSAVNSRGLLFSCDGTIFASDAISPARALVPAAGRSPIATDGRHALLFNSAPNIRRFSTLAADGTGTETFLTGGLYAPGSVLNEGLAVAVGSTALVWTHTRSGYGANLWSFDGLSHHVVISDTTGMGPPVWYGTTADSSHLLITVPIGGRTKAFLWPVNGGPPLGGGTLTPAGSDTLDFRLFADGNVLLHNTIGWQVMLIGANNFTAGALIGGAPNDVPCSVSGNYALLERNFPGPQTVNSWRDDGTHQPSAFSSVDCTSPFNVPTPAPAGRVVFLDNEGPPENPVALPWVATPDLSVVTRLQAISSDTIVWTGTGPGNRDVYAIHHVTGDWDTVIYDATTHTVDPFLVGPASDSGWFVPG